MTNGEKMVAAAILRAQIKFWVTVAGVIIGFAVAIKYLMS